MGRRRTLYLVTGPADVFLDARRKLKEWREAKGISYKRPPMQVKAQVKPPGGALPPSGKDEVDSLICTVDRSLSDCIKLLEEVSVREGGSRGYFALAHKLLLKVG